MINQIEISNWLISYPETLLHVHRYFSQCDKLLALLFACACPLVIIFQKAHTSMLKRSRVIFIRFNIIFRENNIIINILIFNLVFIFKNKEIFAGGLDETSCIACDKVK